MAARSAARNGPTPRSAKNLWRRPTPIAKLGAVGAHGVPSTDDHQNMPRKVKFARPDKGGSKNLNQSAA
eukprot:CAMPEP_0179937122 /NCGR_PEP_ID=MMETSP0983-20121128/14130_1 /TAXON_ID=483367 /ORGANISM="non described non described, Strain CCMP 2436" /LENGTH=68 /DNA_ID=CAMNT_0021842767 /DNA_START=71 /DNA_END=274 /DNA_ORIENTATION=+